MLYPFFDIIVPEDIIASEEEYIASSHFPPILLIVLLILALGLSFYFIRRTIKQSKIDNTPEDSTAPIESDDAE